MGMIKLFRHLKTITTHRHKVVGLCFKLGIGGQGLFHDLSKYSIVELKTGAKYFAGYRSPNSFERDEKGYSDAWLHHKGRNKHHFEYWVDYSAALHRDVAVPMPFNYLLESFADRVAASKVYKKKDYDDSCPLAYFLKDTDPVRMHPESAAIMQRWLTLLAEKGEKVAFREIKAEYKAWKKAQKQDKKDKKKKLKTKTE